MQDWTYDLLPLRVVKQREVNVGDRGVLWIDIGGEAFGYEAEITTEMAQISTFVTAIPIDPAIAAACSDWALVIDGEASLGGPSLAWGESVII